MKTRSLALVLLSMGLYSCQSAEQAEQPPSEEITIYIAGQIYTVDEETPLVTALAVRGGTILATGSSEALREDYPEATVLDFGSATVVPGLIDSHAHLLNLAELRVRADLVGATSLGEVITRLRGFAETLPDSAWLLGRGWDQNDWPDPVFPTRQDLDQAFPTRPVWLERIDGHAMWANSAAIRAAGEDRIRDAEDPAGGRIVRDDAGEPSGIFIDYAEHLINPSVPAAPESQQEQGLDRALAEAARFGLTSVHEAGVDEFEMARLVRFAGSGRLPIRVYAMVEPGPDFETYCNNPVIDLGGRLTIRSVKLYLDGALGSRGAALLEDYSDDPGNRGLLRTGPEEYRDLVRRALGCGYQINTHAIGDAGNRLLLDAYEEAGVTPDGRHRNEHAQILSPEDLPRMAEMGIIAAMQPTHATSDMYWAEDRVGPGRIRGAYAWRTLVDSGTRLALGSDFPVEQVDPLLGFYAGVTRQDADSWPEGGWYPEETLSREETLRGFTLDGAYAGFQEDQIGSLIPGKKADFVVLSDDIMRTPAPKILGSRVMATYVDGKPVYEAR